MQFYSARKRKTRFQPRSIRIHSKSPERKEPWLQHPEMASTSPEMHHCSKKVNLSFLEWEKEEIDDDENDYGTEHDTTGQNEQHLPNTDQNST